MAKQLSQVEKQAPPKRMLQTKPEPESVIPSTNDMTRPLKTVVYEEPEKQYVQEPIDFITQSDLDAYAADYESGSDNPYEDYYDDDDFAVDDEPTVDSVMLDDKTSFIAGNFDVSDIDEPDGIVVDDGIGDMSGLSTYGSDAISSEYLAPHSSGVIELPEMEPVSSRKKWFIAAGATACALALAVGGFLLFGNRGEQPTESSGVVATQMVEEPTTTPTPAPTFDDEDEEEPEETQEYSVPQLSDVVQNLEFDGSPVSVPADVEITAKDGHVLVTQKGAIEDGKYGETLQSVVEGAAAFATELDGDTIDGNQAKRVTWVVKDADDADKFAVTNSTGSAPKQGNFRTVLAASGGYLMDQDWLNKVKDEMGLPNLVAKQGITPTNLDGEAFAIVVPEGTPENTDEQAGETPEGETPEEGNDSENQEQSSGGENNQQQAQQTQQQQQQTQQQTQQPSQSQQSSGSTSGGSTVTRPSSPSQGSTSSGTVTTPSGGYGAQTGSGEKTWVPEKGHYEPITEQVWVDTTTKTTVYHYRCGCGQTFDTADQCQAHQVAARRVDPRHSLVTTTIPETVENPGGHWEEKEVGQQWVVDEPGHWE